MRRGREGAALHGIVRGQQCHLRVNGRRIPAEVVDVRDRVLRMRCCENGFTVERRGIVLEIDHDSGFRSAYFTRLLTSAPDEHTEVILLRSANLNCDELRAFLRVPTEITVSASPLDGSVGFEAKLLNISSGGALIQGDPPYELEYGERLKLTMVNRQVLQVTGELIHFSNGTSVPEQRFGVRFVDVGPDDVRALTWYVWQRVQNFFHSES